MANKSKWFKAYGKIFKNKNTKNKWVLEILLEDTGKVLYRDGSEYVYLKDHEKVILYLNKKGKIMRIVPIKVVTKKLNIEKLLNKKSIRRLLLGDGE